jgi:hypothetical protein
MFIYVSITDKPEFLLEVGDRPIAAFPPTVEGLRNLGRMIAAYSEDGFSFSSSLDFPSECGVSLSSDEIFASIDDGMAAAAAAAKKWESSLAAK